MKNYKPPLTEHPIIRTLVIILFAVIGLIFMSLILDGLYINRFSSAVFAVLLIALINALLWPLLSRVLLPFAVVTGGLLFLILNGVVIMLASYFIDGFEVSSIWTAMITSIGVTGINIILSTIFTINDDGLYYQNALAKRKKHEIGDKKFDTPGIFFLEIDGLALPVLEKAMEQGYAPTIKKWMDDRSHKLIGWETDLSSQTGASQAGLLHGNNFDMPAFRWYDRTEKKIITSSNPDDVSIIEKDHSDGKGLLVDGGASRGNLLSGDAPNVMNTASTLKDLSRFHTSDFYSYFSNPSNFSRTLLLFIWDIILERYRFWQQRRHDVQPRLDKHHRNFKYAIIRGAITTIIRDLNIFTLMGDIFAGTPSAYATFVSYDEVAHHSGVETQDAFDALRKLDQQFARLEYVSKKAPRPYHFVILSDHGQSAGATFKQRYDKTLEDLIQELTKTHKVEKIESAGESMSNINNLLDEVIHEGKSKSANKVVQKVKKHTVDKELEKEENSENNIEETNENDSESPKIAVLASGNLGLVYATERETRLTLEEMDIHLPGMLEGLAEHEGIGFIMIRSAEHGPVVIGSKGRSYLAEERIEGEDPLKGFGENAAQHLIREDSFPNCPDILINSFYNAETNEVAAFEELIGCHGGMGGYQTQPFILYPSEFEIKTEEPLVGAAAVHHVMKDWVDNPSPKEN